MPQLMVGDRHEEIMWGLDDNSILLQLGGNRANPNLKARLKALGWGPGLETGGCVT